MVAYIARGYYQSGFTNRAYYLQDQVYVRTEFRDVWEYELSLTPAENQRPAAHLWELVGRVSLTQARHRAGYRRREPVVLAGPRR